jgi:4-hydroxy-tetrahydrodipicolinate synthase
MPSEVPWLGGVFAALVTPFEKKSGAVDGASFRRLLRRVLPHLDGVVTSGTTGEFSYLERAERRALIEIAVDESGGKPVIAGCGAASTREAIELATDARAAGASASLVVTPYFLHPSDKGVFQHYAEIAARVDLPLILYNIPQVVGRRLSRTVIEDLADLPNVVGLKDSSGDLAYMAEVLENVGERIVVSCGNDEVVLPALAAGASGMILGSAQVMPEIWQQILRRFRDGDVAGARAQQREVQKLARLFARYGGPVAVKAALRKLGVDVGPPRAPLEAVGGALMHETRGEIQLELEKIGLLPGSDAPVAYPKQPLSERFADLEITPEQIAAHGLRVGTGTAGAGTDKAQIDLIAGGKATPLGDAYALQLTYPLQGREALTTILEPNLTVRPSTLLLPTLEQRNLRQANMIYGPTQSAVAHAIAEELASGAISREAAERDVMVAMVTIHPNALDRHRVAQNVFAAATEALRGVYGDRAGAKGARDED